MLDTAHPLVHLQKSQAPSRTLIRFLSTLEAYWGFRALRALPNLLLPNARRAVEGGDDLDKSPSPAIAELINYQDDREDGGQENRHAQPGDGTTAGNKRNRSPGEQSRSPEVNRPPLEPVSTLHYIQHLFFLLDVCVCVGGGGGGLHCCCCCCWSSVVGVSLHLGVSNSLQSRSRK